MSWFKIDDGWWSHPKTLQLSDAAIALWSRAGSWSCQQLTDGLVSPDALAMLRGKPVTARELVKVGYWDVVSGGWQFHDWEDYQEHSDVVKKRREDARERMRRVRANKGGTFDEGSQEVRSTPSRPDPTRPVTTDSEVPPVLNRAGNSTDEGVIQARRAVLSGLGIKDFGKVKAAIVAATSRDVSDEQAQGIIGGLLAKATGPVKYPQAYVLRSITESWAEVQQVIDEEEEAS